MRERKGNGQGYSKRPLRVRPCPLPLSLCSSLRSVGPRGLLVRPPPCAGARLPAYVCAFPRGARKAVGRTLLTPRLLRALPPARGKPPPGRCSTPARKRWRTFWGGFAFAPLPPVPPSPSAPAGPARGRVLRVLCCWSWPVRSAPVRLSFSLFVPGLRWPGVGRLCLVFVGLSSLTYYTTY